MNYLQILQLAAPETALTITVLMVLAVDLIVVHGQTVEQRFRAGMLVSIIGCLLAAILALAHFEQGNGLHGLLVVDQQTDFLKVVLLMLTIFTVLISASGKFTEHVGEYLSLGSAGDDWLDVARQR